MSIYGVKIYADGADLATIKELAEKDYISGFTTNPTLMRKAGVTDYEHFARQVLELTDKPVSFELITDELDEMVHQGKKIASWGPNVFVKVPITNTQDVSTGKVVKELNDDGVKVNVTAVTTYAQVISSIRILGDSKTPSNISIFAGRIADTGTDPMPLVEDSLRFMRMWNSGNKIELIWASPREVFNVQQAANCGCHIITVTNDILKKLDWLGRDHKRVSLDTVKMFYNDAVSSGLKI